MSEEDPRPRADVRQWLVEAHLPARVRDNIARIAQSEGVRHVVVLPDIHLGRSVNNGCVVATRERVYPQTVGSDIGCGFSAIGFRSPGEVLIDDRQAQQVIQQLYRTVPALKQQGKQELPARLSLAPLSDEVLLRQQERDGSYQLGTLGCGNHFIELQRDDAGALWLMVHSGSRAMGQAITRFHLSRAQASRTGLMHLDACSQEGQACLNDMQWAAQYATINRLAIMALAVEILSSLFGIAADEDTYIDSPHNFARRERHFGEELIVHRKSANSAQAAERGLIAGSMGTPSFVVEGLGAESSLCSSSHGAGRVMSRTEARRRIRTTDLKRQLGPVRHDPRHLASLTDEAPAAYRCIEEVLRAQRDLVRQVARLTPVLNFKYPDRRDT